MARYTGPKSKIARKLGEAIFGEDKVLARKNYAPGQHGANRVGVDGRNALLRIDAAAQCAAAVDDDQCQLILRTVGLEAVNRNQTGELYNFIQAFRGSAAAGDVHNLIALFCGSNNQRAAKTTGTAFYLNGSIFSHVSVPP